MEIAGGTCTVCGQHITFAQEGKSCPACGIVVHRTCDNQSTCARCGREYETLEPPVVDITRDAFLSRSLRPNNTAIPFAVAIFGALLILILLFFSMRLFC